MPYDLFISYSRRDNQANRITELKERIEADYRTFTGEDLRCFFDTEAIKGMDDWRHRILHGLRNSNLLVLVLSPSYLASSYCEWEIVEYLKYEHSRVAAGQGVAPIYFVEVPGLDSPDFERQAAAWIARVRCRNHFDLRPWYDEGAAALKRGDVRVRLEDLERTLQIRISKLRRLAIAPGNLPAHNPYFVGRETEMQRLHESAGLGRFGVLTAIQGVGGLGKSALAIQYAYAYADFYPGGRWLVGCASAKELACVLRRLDTDLGITFNEEQKRDDDKAARRILAELEARARSGAAARGGEKAPPQPCALILLDNVDVPELLQPPQTDLISGKNWLHVVATTRLGGDDFGHDSERQTLLTVDELPMDDAVRLIASHQPQGTFSGAVEQAAAEGIARLLGGFTLAIEVVAVYLGERRGQITCAAFLERLQHEGLAGFESVAKATKGAVNHRQKLIGATLGPTLDLLGPAESLVLTYASLLQPDAIPLPWLRALVATDHPELGEDAEPGYDDPWLSLVNHLFSLRLLQVVDANPDTHSPRSVRMHRLVGELVRAHARHDLERHRQRLASYLKARCTELARIWYLHQWEIPAIIAFSHDLLDRRDACAPKFIRALCQWLPAFDTGRHSEPILRACLAQLEADLSDDPSDTFVILSNLAWALHELGRRTDADAVFRRAIEIDETGQPVRCTVLDSCPTEQGRQGEVDSFCRRALDQMERNIGSENPATVIWLNQLAVLLGTKGYQAQAEPLLRRAAAIGESIFGLSHPSTLTSVNNLALLLQDTGRLDEAEPLLHRSMEARKVVYGSIHPATANGSAGYAMVLARLKRDPEAVSLAREALEIWKQTSVPDDFRTGKAHWVLGTIAARGGDPVSARAHLSEAMKQLSSGFGDQHPWVVEVKRELEELS